MLTPIYRNIFTNWASAHKCVQHKWGVQAKNRRWENRSHQFSPSHQIKVLRLRRNSGASTGGHVAQWPSFHRPPDGYMRQIPDWWQRQDSAWADNYNAFVMNAGLSAVVGLTDCAVRSWVLTCITKQLCKPCFRFLSLRGYCLCALSYREVCPSNADILSAFQSFIQHHPIMIPTHLLTRLSKEVQCRSGG